MSKIPGKNIWLKSRNFDKTIPKPYNFIKRDRNFTENIEIWPKTPEISLFLEKQPEKSKFYRNRSETIEFYSKKPESR